MLLGYPPAFWLGLVVSGVALGGLYALFGSGLTLIFGAAKIMNFAQGEFFMVGGYVAVFSAVSLGLGFWPTLAVTTAALGLLGLGLNATIFRRVTQNARSLEIGIVMTLGLSLVLQEGALQLFGSTARRPVADVGVPDLRLGGVTIEGVRLVSLGLAVIALAGLGWFLTRTRAGLAVRAMPQNRELAATLGIRTSRVNGYAIGIGTALSGLAAAAVAPYYGVYPSMGAGFGFVAFAIVFMGGLTSVAGSVVAALIVGVVTSLVGGAISATAASAIPLIIMALVVLVRPQGLFGRAARKA
ncbi:branched-chain amino acid ABC transporter permease [Micromonospora sp. NPDC000316]|uniref:branched-chain amino acid ABC transporter permease n=1 Tax=Micromonospora sp. NPDC000316 TaxID=3364216 RepID=UPI0036C5F50B